MQTVETRFKKKKKITEPF